MNRDGPKGAASVVAADVSVRYDGQLILDSVDMHAEPGEWVTIIGPNGAGKSTLMRALAGLEAHPGVTIDGVPLSSRNARERARTLAFVPQSPTIPPGMTVANYLLLGRTPHIGLFGAEGPDDLARCARLIERLDLDDHQEQMLTTLSGGELQRVLIGRALAQSTSLVLLDEPTSALDIGHQHDVLSLLDTLRHEHDFTIITTMHDLTLASDFSDRLVLLADGRVRAVGRPDAVLQSDVLATTYGAQVDVIEHDGRRIVVPARRKG